MAVKPRNPESEEERLEQAVTLILQDLRALFTTMQETRDAQFQRPPSASSAQEEIRSRGGHNDPTGDTVADPRRLGLRHQRKRAVRELEKLSRHLSGLVGDLQAAADRWAG